MAVRTPAACPGLAGELACLTRALTAPRCTMQSRGLAGRARPRRILDPGGVLHRLHDIVAGIWHVEGVVPVRDRLTYPQLGHRAHRPGPLS